MVVVVETVMFPRLSQLMMHLEIIKIFLINPKYGRFFKFQLVWEIETKYFFKCNNKFLRTISLMQILTYLL